jgi:60 kDa SS-A/Ro ribonucleoprotein
MVKNTDGGGYAFQIGDEARFERFVILGNEGGTYYASERELTIQNANVVLRIMAKADTAMSALNTLAEISDLGRAPKNDPALFALAIATASGDQIVRKRAWEFLPKIARIGTHLFKFAQYREAMGGWGPLARKGVANWYLAKSPNAVAFQALKYQQRDGWSHRDLLRLSHAHSKIDGDPMNAVFSAITHPEFSEFKVRDEQRVAYGIERLIGEGRLPLLFEGVMKARRASSAKEIAGLIQDYGLQREMLDTKWHNDPIVLVALFEKQPMTAMLRNLGNLSKAGVLIPMSVIAKEVCARLRNEELLAKARIHPLSILLAQRTYGSGKGRRGKGEWVVVPQVVDALEEAFLLSFNYAPRTGKRWMLGVDVSSSMTSQIGDTGISSCEMAALMALVIAKREEEYFVGGFASGYVDLKITAKDTLKSAAKKAQKSNFGLTDIGSAITYAFKNKIPVDVFMLLTDNEGNCGEQPMTVVQRYRDKHGINSKLVSCAFTASEYTIGDPTDPRVLNCVGLDANVPAVVADFATH